MKSRTLLHGICALALITALASSGHAQTATPSTVPTGNVIFLHPDGTGANQWGAFRIFQYGPDGTSNWDRMARMALYRGHMKDSVVGTSNAGAVTHSTGVKVHARSFGLLEDGKTPVTSLSGKAQTVFEEAVAGGKATALINSGIISEPGTGAFAARVENRGNHTAITAQVLESKADIILGGGEVWYLPKGVVGRFGVEGKREDNLNLIDRAKALGYTLVYTAEELRALPTSTKKVLGIFAPEDTYFTTSEEELKKRGSPNYFAGAPTIAEMLSKTLELFRAQNRSFFIVAEEEGTDNYCNPNNANACFEAMSRADAAIGVGLEFIKQNPNTLMLTAADSDAGGMQLVAQADATKPVAKADQNGAPLDGREGTETLPFLSAPDAQGKRWPFAVAWSTFSDTAGGIVARADGLNANLMGNLIDNTDIYRMMHATLFGKVLPAGVVAR